MKNVKINKIEKLNEKFDLYDIETENHNFYANDILVHNSNAGFCFNSQVGHWFQSRENIITIEKDNAACAFNGEANLAHWMKIVHNLANTHNIDLHNNILTVFYEWGGGSIQKNSAVTGLDKLSYIFQHFKVSPVENKVDANGRTTNATWHETWYLDDEKRMKIWVDDPAVKIYNTMNFKHWEFEIDFSRPSFAQNMMIELVENTIEPNSPLGNQLGKENNIGEGIVVTFMYKDVLYRFKVKGKKHSNSKVKTLKPVDTEKEQVKIDFANYACPGWRLEQMFNLANDTINGNTPDIKNIGTFIKYVNIDILKEESDILHDKGLEPKDIFPLVAKIIKNWYIEQLNKSVGLS